MTRRRAPDLSRPETPYSENVEPVSWSGDDDQLLDVRQAAALLAVKASTLSFWAREGGCR